MTITTIKSKTGADFKAEVGVELSGALTIRTEQRYGYLSAHRDYALEHFGHVSLWRMNHLSWLNKGGVRVVLTRWHTKSFLDS